MKNKSLVIAKILYALLLTGMIILILLTNNKINITLLKTFTGMYLFLIIVNLIYIPSVTLRNTKNSKSIYIYKKSSKKIHLIVYNNYYILLYLKFYF